MFLKRVANASTKVNEARQDRVGELMFDTEAETMEELLWVSYRLLLYLHVYPPKNNLKYNF